MSEHPVDASEHARIVAGLREHAAEWRGDEAVGRVRWVCAAGDWAGDDYDQWRHHVADQITGTGIPRGCTECGEAPCGYGCDSGSNIDVLLESRPTIPAPEPPVGP